MLEERLHYWNLPQYIVYSIDIILFNPCMEIPACVK